MCRWMGILLATTLTATVPLVATPLVTTPITSYTTITPTPSTHVIPVGTTCFRWRT